MFYKVLEPVFIRSEGKSYKPGEKIEITEDQKELFTKKLEDNEEQFTDYFEEVGEDYGPTETIENFNEGE